MENGPILFLGGILMLLAGLRELFARSTASYETVDKEGAPAIKTYKVHTNRWFGVLQVIVAFLLIIAGVTELHWVTIKLTPPTINLPDIFGRGTG